MVRSAITMILVPSSSELIYRAEAAPTKTPVVQHCIAYWKRSAFDGTEAPFAFSDDRKNVSPDAAVLASDSRYLAQRHRGQGSWYLKRIKVDRFVLSRDTPRRPRPIS
ncbi:hypothetical protein F4679DRAFT_311832 [Xylaria curta]|nr:hypothetical protein F4679DRAFT_311832 [Xylaria curta]